LSEVIKKPPYNLTTEIIWNAYEHLEKSKIRGAGPKKLLTNIISLLRFALGDIEYLEPFSEIVDQRFEKWLKEQANTGRIFSAEQMEWLIMIKDHIMTSISIEMDHFKYEPFYERGGSIRAYQVFGDDLNKIMNDLNKELIA